MRFLSHTCPTLAENLAFDEALIDEAESASNESVLIDPSVDDEVLRLWESPSMAVVLGRSSKVADEIDLEQCRRQSVEIGRRCSGGATVAIGPGCLMYGVLLSMRLRPECRQLDVLHRFVMQRMVDALSTIGITAQFCGTCDLTIDGRKFSGNSVRCKRNHVLYHGTILYDYPLASIQSLLGTPPRQPDYRAGRDHQSFVTNVSVDKDRIARALRKVWQAEYEYDANPSERISRLVADRYSQVSWTFLR